MNLCALTLFFFVQFPIHLYFCRRFVLHLFHVHLNKDYNIALGYVWINIKISDGRVIAMKKG